MDDRSNARELPLYKRRPCVIVVVCFSRRRLADRKRVGVEHLKVHQMMMLLLKLHPAFSQHC